MIIEKLILSIGGNKSLFNNNNNTNNNTMSTETKMEIENDNKTENEIKINGLNELSYADHVVFVKDKDNYSHGIVEDINEKENLLTIIYYDDGKIQCSLDDFLFDKCSSNNKEASNQKPVKRKTGVFKAKIRVDFSKFEIYKIIYDEKSGEKCLSTEDTLKKARKFIGQAKYNTFANNDEHFAIYCKTGKAGKLFIVNPNKVNVGEIIGTSVADKLKGTLASAGTNLVLVSTAKHIATKFPRSVAAASLPAVAEAAGSVIGIGIEGVSMGYDIHKKYKENKDGKISTLKFKKYVTKRVTRGAFGAAGGIGGAVVGQMVIPVPVLGAIVGGFVGGLLGAAVGQGNGILLAKVVEKVDTKIKEKQELEKIEILEREYQVVQNLVMKFDKNKFAQLDTYDKQEEIEVKTDLKTDLKTEVEMGDVDKVPLEHTALLQSQNTPIDQDDYEIFVLTEPEGEDDAGAVSDIDLNTLTTLSFEPYLQTSLQDK